jgi:regulator of RNase E activity RraA
VEQSCRVPRTHRLAGILADGRLRDFAELPHYDLAICCRGENHAMGRRRMRGTT